LAARRQSEKLLGRCAKKSAFKLPAPSPWFGKVPGGGFFCVSKSRGARPAQRAVISGVIFRGDAKHRTRNLVQLSLDSGFALERRAPEMTETGGLRGGFVYARARSFAGRSKVPPAGPEMAIRKVAADGAFDPGGCRPPWGADQFRPAIRKAEPAAAGVALSVWKRLEQMVAGLWARATPGPGVSETSTIATEALANGPVIRICWDRSLAPWAVFRAPAAAFAHQVEQHGENSLIRGFCVDREPAARIAVDPDDRGNPTQGRRTLADLDDHRLDQDHAAVGRRLLRRGHKTASTGRRRWAAPPASASASARSACTLGSGTLAS